MADELKELVTELGSTFEDFKQKNDERLKQLEQKGEADSLLEDQVNKMSGKLDELEQKKEQLETAMNRKHVASDSKSDDLDQKAQAFEELCAKKRGIQPEGKMDGKALTEYKQAFREFMRKGDMMGMDSQKALSVGTDPDGGYAVEPDTSGRIVQKVYETSPMRQVAAVQSIGTDALEGLYDLDEASAGWVHETAGRPESDTPKLGAWRIPVHEIYAFPFATQKVLDDAMIDLESWLSGKVSDKFSRKENEAFVNGDGISKPRGFLTYPDGTSLPGQIERKKTGVNGGFATDGTGGDVLLDTVYALKQQYRSGARWAMPRSVTAEVRKIKDADGMYLWQPGIAAGQPAQLLGFPVIEFEDMPDLGTGSLSMAFGNWGEAYQIVDRQGVRVLRDPYTNKPYVGFYTVKRTGGDVLNFEALKLVSFAS
jgi:HK97 family phage major capsid protein